MLMGIAIKFHTKFALVNNLWLGQIPQELAILTLPEQLLVL